MHLNFKLSPVKLLLSSCILGSLLSGCGGGGSSVATTPPVPTPPVSPPETQTPDTAPPQARITFPSAVSRVSGDNMIWVRGVASDETGISEVRVNGVAAQLNEVTASTQSRSANTTAKDVSNNSVEWSVQIPVSSEIVVETIDTEGNQNTNAASSTLYSGEVPGYFVIDDENQRLLGFRFNSSQILNIDLNSGIESHIKTSTNMRSVDIAFAAQENLLITADYDYEGGVNLFSIDPDTGSQSILTNFQVPDINGDMLFFHINQVQYLSSENSAYINTYIFSEVSYHQNYIVKYDFNSATLTEVVNGPVNENIITSRNMVVSDDGLFITNDQLVTTNSYTPTGTQRLSLDGSEVVQVADISPQLITIDDDTPETIYGISIDEVTKTNIATGEVTTISSNDPNQDLNLTQIRVADVDHTNNRLLVGDSTLDMVMSIDLETGERSRFIHYGVGNGKALIDPRHIALEESTNTLYVGDSGENAPEAIIAVDLNTGDRRQIGDINLPLNHWFNDLVIDETERQLYIAYNNSILRMDLETEESTTFFDFGTLAESPFNWLNSVQLDKEGNRLIISGAESNALYALDLADASFSLISEADETNVAADLLSWPFHSTINHDTGEALMLGRVKGKVVFNVIDLETGERTVSNDICSSIPDFQPDSDYIVSVKLVLSEDNKVMLMADNALYELDLPTGSCQSLFIDYNQIITDIVKTENAQWFYSTLNGIKQFDMESRQSVIVSK